MIFKSVDEMSLRHLFSSSYAEEILRMSYLGPVLDPLGKIQSSPDCLILDKRKNSWRIRRCEFKWIPEGEKDFEHNGKFDIAIVWNLPPTVGKEKLAKELFSQNECQEVIVLSENKRFRELAEYRILNSDELNGIDDLRKVLLESRKVKYPTVYAAYIAAAIYPEVFQMDKLVDHLSEGFVEVRKMLPQGRANIVSSLLQTKPPLIKRLHGRTYCWVDNINATIAVKEMEEIIRTNFMNNVPSSDVVALFKK